MSQCELSNIGGQEIGERLQRMVVVVLYVSPPHRSRNDFPNVCVSHFLTLSSSIASQPNRQSVSQAAANQQSEPAVKAIDTTAQHWLSRRARALVY